MVPAMDRRLISAAFALGAAAVAAVVLLAGGAGAPGLDPVARAAQATAAQQGAQMLITGHVSVAGTPSPITLRGSGEMDMRGGEGRLRIDVAGLPSALLAQVPGGGLSMEELFIAPNVYVGSPLLAGRLPGSARWVRVDLSKVQGSLGVDPSSITSGETDPSQYLSMLRAAGATARVVGHESLHGVPTTRYSAKVNLLKAAESSDPALHRMLPEVRQLIARSGIGTLPLEVWVDGSGLVRRIALSMAAGEGSAHAVVSLTVDYSGFGPIRPVVAPAPSEVLDATGQALSGLGTAG